MFQICFKVHKRLIHGDMVDGVNCIKVNKIEEPKCQIVDSERTTVCNSKRTIVISLDELSWTTFLLGFLLLCNFIALICSITRLSLSDLKKD